MDSDKNNNIEPVFNDKIELVIKRFDNLMYTLLNSYYFYSIFVSSLYSFITIDTKTVYDFVSQYQEINKGSGKDIAPSLKLSTQKLKELLGE